MKADGLFFLENVVGDIIVKTWNRNEVKIEILKNKEILLMNRDLLKKFEKDVEALESVIKTHQERKIK